MKPKLPLYILVFAILCVLGGSHNAQADTLCAIYPDEAGSAFEPVINMGAPAGSVQVAVMTGSGAVGSYQPQKSNDGVTWVNDGSAVSSAGVTALASVNAEKYRVLMTVPPDSGTQVKVCLNLSNPK